jgi:single-strand DNA-binding protein
MSVNKAILIGNVGKDPECKQISNGTMALFSLATTESYKDKNSGELVKTTDWHRVVCFGKTADVVAKYVKKGSKLYVEGKIKNSKYTDKNGVEKYSTDIQAMSIQMLDNKQDAASRATDGNSQRKLPSSNFANDDPFSDEIPF